MSYARFRGGRPEILVILSVMCDIINFEMLISVFISTASRAGRVRKKNSLLADFESLEDHVELPKKWTGRSKSPKKGHKVLTFSV